MKKIIISFIIILLIACSCDPNTDSEKLKPIPIDIYALMGQSNMVGCDSTPLYRDINNDILYLTTSNEIKIVENDLWSPYIESLYPGIQVSQNYTLGIGFADTIYDENKILLIPCARGASSIYEQIYPNQTGWGGVIYEDSLLDECINRIDIALGIKGPFFDPKLKGVLYYQGESDSNRYEEWENGMLILIDTLEAKYENFKFVFAQLCRVEIDNIEKNNEINTIFDEFKINQTKFSKTYGYDMVITEDLKLSHDGIHLTSESLKIIGERFAEKF